MNYQRMQLMQNVSSVCLFMYLYRVQLLFTLDVRSLTQKPAHVARAPKFYKEMMLPSRNSAMRSIVGLQNARPGIRFMSLFSQS